MAFERVSVPAATLRMVLVLVPVPFTAPESTMLPVDVPFPLVSAWVPRLTPPDKVKLVAATELNVVAAERVSGPANEFVPPRLWIAPTLAETPVPPTVTASAAP